MCGLAGLAFSDFDPHLARLHVEDGLSLLGHRGPDDQGVLALDGVVLGHTRLAIIDINGGHQPLTVLDGRYSIVFNGEIYNYLEIKKTLRDLGHSFSTDSDTEVLLVAFCQWKEKLLDFIKGMFAFAIWDRDEKSLFIARDHFGKKPFFYFEGGNKFFFGSEIKSVLASSKHNKSINRGALSNYLLYRYVPSPDTLFEGVYKLPAGSFGYWKNGKLDIQSYYSPPDKNAFNNDFIDIKNPTNRFWDLLSSSVEKRMVGEVPFGAFLSGGIDSSAVVALMARNSSMPINTFSVGFEEGRFSELSYARVIAKKFKTNHHELVVNPMSIIENLTKVTKFRDAPISEPSDIPIYLLALEAGKSVKMILTGEGADEVLAGYPKHQFEAYSNIFSKNGFHQLSLFLRLFSKFLPYKYHRLDTAINTLSNKQDYIRMPRWFGAFSSDSIKELFNQCNQEPIRNSPPFDFDSDASGLRKSLYFDQTSWLPDNLLERGDRMTMAASIEARMPFLDVDLIHYVSSLPDNWRLRGGSGKYILREAMKKVLPSNIINRPKVGFKIPVNEWFRSSLKDYLLDLIKSNDSICSNHFNQKVIDKILDEHLSGKKNHEKIIWTLISLEIWKNSFF